VQSHLDLLKLAVDRQQRGRRLAACLVVGARGSTPQSAGALMLVDDAAGTHGTIGGGCVEAEVRQRALPIATRGGSGLMSFKLDHDYGWDDGLICGGTLDLAVAPLPESEQLVRIVDDVAARRATSLDLRVDTDDGPTVYRLHLPPRQRLYIAGAGHVGQAVARLALGLDFEVTVFDDRADLMERYLPAGATRRVGDIAKELAAAPVDGHTFCLVVTRGHRHDEQALAAVVGRGAAYVGMIGSRRKVKLTFDDLQARGVSAADLECVRAPVGLAIGAVTVEEIAISIVAQLVEERRDLRVKTVEGPLPVDASGAAAAGSR
jgi:xanthine dehydrogenase accessory factor